VPGGQDGVTVSAAPGDRVVLKGLTINGQGGNTGIHVLSGQEIYVESCTVSGMGLEGILIEGGTTIHVADTTVRGNGLGLHALSGAGSRVHVRNSRFARNSNVGVQIDGGSFDGSGLVIEETTGSVGMFVTVSTAGLVAVSLADSVLDGNAWGFVAFSTVAGGIIRASAKHVTSSRNGNAGFESNASNVGDVVLTVAESASVGNGSYGITATNGANTVVSNTASTGNVGPDLYQTGGGFMRTSGNNTLSGRGAPDVGGALTPNPMQ
jgi:Right handed beta helix region